MNDKTPVDTYDFITATLHLTNEQKMLACLERIEKLLIAQGISPERSKQLEALAKTVVNNGGKRR